jgi:hypothetical protein
VREHGVDIDLRPLELVADAFTRGKRKPRPDFEF